MTKFTGGSLLVALVVLSVSGHARGSTSSEVTRCNEDDSSVLLSVRRASTKAERRSMDLERHLASVAERMPDGVTRQLFEQFKICGQCSAFERFGERNDGGYLMCMDGLRKGSVAAVYSLGVREHDQWSDDAADALAITVNQFDCTVNNSSCKNCKFFKKCIVSSDGNHPVPGHEEESWNLHEALEATAQADAPDGSLLMKMDIDGSEWPIFFSEPPELLRKFGQLVVEFHKLRFEDRHAEYLRAMQHIAAAGFRVAHLHGNNLGGMYENGGLRVPFVVEVTFVRGSARPDGCVSEQLHEALDAPNKAGKPDLPMARMG